MPFSTIIRTAMTVSRGSAGFGSPVSMTIAMIVTSMLMTEMVRISVP